MIFGRQFEYFKAFLCLLRAFWSFGDLLNYFKRFVLLSVLFMGFFVSFLVIFERFFIPFKPVNDFCQYFYYKSADFARQFECHKTP